jgi:pimeloyl-ACP methyl ester carboxylesterase
MCIVPARLIIRITLAAFIVCTTSARASPVLDIESFPAADGMRLNALYWAPPSPSKSIVLLIPGLNGAVMGAGHDYRPLANALAEQGYALLFPQLRSLTNWSYAFFDDVVNDIGGAVAFAKLRGYERIALFGTSLGGPRLAFYMARRGDPSIRAVGFINSIKSPYLAFQISQTELERARFDALLAKARKLVVEGRGGELVAFEHYFPDRHMAMTARSFISFNGRDDESNAVSIKFAPQIKVPALVIHGTADDIALEANAIAIYESLSAAPKRDLLWVDGAGHFLTPGPIAETYAEKITEWLVTNMPNPAAAPAR